VNTIVCRLRVSTAALYHSSERKDNSPILEIAFGKAVRSRREALGISQEELAFRADIHRTYVSQIERGLKSPSLSVIVKLAEALELSPAELVGQATVNTTPLTSE
jgi:transcriptional regulator with XRE-family HTH domain